MSDHDDDGPARESGSSEVEAALERIRKRVAERRAMGDYPPGMEKQLDHHYRALVSTLATEHAAVEILQEAVSELDRMEPFGASRIERTSRHRLVRMYQRIWARLARHQTRGVLAQMQDYAVTVRRVVDRMSDVVETLALHGHPETERRVATIADRLSSLEEIARRLDDIEARLPPGEARHGDPRA
ncbi:hypothetical protein [Rhabdothermincola salaria]|uniref:hypothetical protein n=1 Tax=Rhabdothermincola salaria TaxID=2903142 RepID=UPI001E2DF6AD|nr:hypothetical protein [Rhabdothermincola salaria]MCD9623378.1 hypothetical protein [Rhabdothermincola salaria]